MSVTTRKSSITVRLTEVLTPRAIRAGLIWLLSAAMVYGALSKLTLASRHFRMWSDLEMIDLLPIVGTFELFLAVLLVARRTRPFGVALVVVYHVLWIALSVDVDDFTQAFRSAALFVLGLLGLLYGRRDDVAAFFRRVGPT